MGWEVLSPQYCIVHVASHCIETATGTSLWGLSEPGNKFTDGCIGCGNVIVDYQDMAVGCGGIIATVAVNLVAFTNVSWK